MKTTGIPGSALLLFAAALATPAAHAADRFPARPVRVIVPYAPGGATDIIARHVATRLNEAWGQAVVVDNRAGASGNIGLEAVARATPDGYTLFVGNVTTNAINETTFASALRIRPSRDLTGVTNLIELPHVLLVNPNVPAKTVKDLVDHAKRPGVQLNYGSAGLGSYPHLDMVMFTKAAGVEMTHIPYKGGAGQMMPAIIGGEVNLFFVNLASSLEFLRNGRLRALATTAPNRLAELPAVPTMAESGFPGIGTNAWNGMFAPAAIPRAVLGDIHRAVTGILQRPEMRELLAKQLMAPVPSASPDAFQQFVRAETDKWARVIRDNNIRVE
jgi:tripartite-type tricarboxylate transporter receptor subunit TctC